jgi:hypothetical protein
MRDEIRNNLRSRDPESTGEIPPSSAAQTAVGAIWQGGVPIGTGVSEQERARFHWTDEETGERMLVEVKGDGAFFANLAELGFEREEEPKLERSLGSGGAAGITSPCPHPLEDRRGA